MKTVEFKVVGMLPGLLMSSPKAMLIASGDKPTSSKRVIPTPEEESERQTYRLDNGDIFFPTTGFRSALIDGGKHQRVGKLAAPGLISSCVFNVTDKAPLLHPKTGKPIRDFIITTMRCGQGSGFKKVYVMRSRPLIAEWATSIVFEYDDDMLAPETIKTFFEIAGKRIGVGNFRPGLPRGDCYGRFTVELTK